MAEGLRVGLTSAFGPDMDEALARLASHPAELERIEFEPRTYIEIQPADAAISVGAAITSFEQLYARLDRWTETGLVSRLRGNAQRPILEWLVVADGRPDPSISYLVGTQFPELTDELVDVLHTGVPDTYEVSPVEFHPAMAEEFIPSSSTESTRSTPTPGTNSGDQSSKPYIAGVEYVGQPDRSRDWQTAFATWTGGPARGGARGRRADGGELRRPGPLAGIVETLTESEVPVVFQIVAMPLPDWSGQADQYIQALEEGTAGRFSTLSDLVSPRSAGQRREYTPKQSHRERIQSIQQRDQGRSFQVSIRAVAMSRDAPEAADRTARSLVSSLHGMDGSYHEIEGVLRSDGESALLGSPRPGWELYLDLLRRRVAPIGYRAWRRRLPLREPFSRGIVTDAAELSHLCLLNGATLTPDGSRALASRRGERTALPLPPGTQLARYSGPGMALCMPLTHDRQPYGRRFYLPPAVQDRHVIVAGETGSGKSVLIETAMLSNAAATAGPDILFDYKGGGTATEYLRSHFAARGDLDDVYYFDLAQVLPALSFFDIGPLLDAGIPREEARSRKAGHYEEILAGLMGPETYGEAAESVKAIRNHLRALYDPVHGSDGFSHAELYDALARTLRGQGPPETSDDDALTTYFESLDERDRDIFKKILGGAMGRVETIATDGRLAPLFDHTHHLAEDAPAFDFDELLEDDAVVIFDFGALAAGAKRALALVILSSLWTALKARSERGQTDEQSSQLVNVYLEEARDLVSTRLLDTLLAEGRGFGLSVTLGVQFVEQLQAADPDRSPYQEALNETGTFLVGNVAVDRHLSDVFATEAMDPDGVDRRLSSLASGEWLVRPAAAFGEEPPRPFLGRSLDPPAGHPSGDAALSGDDEEAFRAAFERCRRETRSSRGLDLAEWAGGAHGEEPASRGAGEPTADESSGAIDGRVDTLLTHTDRLPPHVYFDEDRDAVRCDRCGEAYGSDATGLIDAVECCYSLEEVDREDIPICDIDLKLSREEILESPWSVKQLLFLKAVYNAQNLRYEPPVYDLLHDSMIRLEEYVGIDDESVEELIESGLLHRNNGRPHRLYSVYADARDAIGETHRSGVDFGHGAGDIRESSEHVMGVELGKRLVAREYVESEESPVVTVRTYHALREGQLPATAYHEETASDRDETGAYERRRVDVAGLDDDGDVVVAVEVERVHSNSAQEVPADFDKLAACDPAEAIWIVMNRRAGHAILDILYDPPSGDPRIDQRYSDETPLQRVSIDSPGLTGIYSIVYLRDSRYEE